MVTLQEAEAWNATLVRRRGLVAVFFGGTSGIGDNTVRALARTAGAEGRGVRAYLVGRNAEAGRRIAAACRALCPRGDFRFVECGDLARLADVDEACVEIASAEGRRHADAPDECGDGESDGGGGPRIDYLMMSHAGAVFQPRRDTEEGLDATMSLMYYSRMRITRNLLPLLLRSAVPATVVSVYAAGTEDRLFADDLSLRGPGRYSYTRARSHVCYLKTAYFESLARRHPGRLRLVHVFPGLVLGPGFENPDYPAWFRFVFLRVLVPLLGRWVLVPRDENGARMLALASPRYPPGPGGQDGRQQQQQQQQQVPALGTDGQLGSGAYALGWDGEDRTNRKAYDGFDETSRMDMQQKMCDHTDKVFEVIAAGGAFME